MPARLINHRGQGQINMTGQLPYRHNRCRPRRNLPLCHGEPLGNARLIKAEHFVETAPLEPPEALPKQLFGGRVRCGKALPGGQQKHCERQAYKLALSLVHQAAARSRNGS